MSQKEQSQESTRLTYRLFFGLYVDRIQDELYLHKFKFFDNGIIEDHGNLNGTLDFSALRDYLNRQKAEAILVCDYHSLNEKELEIFQGIKCKVRFLRVTNRLKEDMIYRVRMAEHDYHAIQKDKNDFFKKCEPFMVHVVDDDTQKTGYGFGYENKSEIWSRIFAEAVISEELMFNFIEKPTSKSKG